MHFPSAVACKGAFWPMVFQISFSSYLDQLTVRFSSNRPPDIVHLPTRNFTSFAAEGWLAPLDDRLAGTDIIDSWTPLQRALEWDGQMQGVLLLGYGYVLYYNERLLQAAGVNPPTNPDEMLLAAEKLTAGGVFGFAASTAQHPNVYVDVSHWVIGMGQHWVKDGAYAFTDPAVIEAVDYYRKATTFAPSGTGSEQARTLFFDGKAAMLIDGPFVLSQRDSAAADVKPHVKVALAPFQTVPGAISNSLHIPKSASEETQDAVWEFIELVTRPEWQEAYARLYNVPPPRKDVLSAELLSERPELQLFSEAAAQAVDIFPTSAKVAAEYGRFSQLIEDAMIRLQTTEDDTAKVLAETQDKALDEIGEP